jgi:hypothetical protein
MKDGTRRTRKMSIKSNTPGIASDMSGVLIANQRSPKYIMNEEKDMPYKSKAQEKLFFAKEAKGELPKGTAKEWAHETKNIKKLPEHVKKESNHRHREHR